MVRSRMSLWAAAASVVALVAACGGSGKSATSSASGTTSTSAAATGTTQTVNVGILTDLTGPAASSNKTSVQGVQAGVPLAARAGYKLNYVVGDTATSPSGALSAAQKLVEQDHVNAVVAVSSLTFAAASYLTSRGVPVVGVAEDGPEWMTAANMFSSFGPTDLTKVATTHGQFFKMEGATALGTLGYSISPSSAEAAKGTAASAQAVGGLKVPYVNANFPFGSTNVQPVALAMKSAGVNGMEASVDPNTGLTLVTALRQSGADIKVALLPTGYGGDLQQAGPGAVQAAQNVYFLSVFQPVEMKTAATRQLQSDLRTAGVATDPTYAEYAGYTSVALLVDGLKGAGPNPTSAALISALSGVHSFNAAGLLGTNTIDMSDRTGSPAGPNNCQYFTKLSGSKFQLVPKADPLCGTIVAGKTVSSS